MDLEETVDYLAEEFVLERSEYVREVGAADAGPFAEQQRLFKLLSRDTRHLIIQELLGHFAHLMSLPNSSI